MARKRARIRQVIVRVSKEAAKREKQEPKEPGKKGTAVESFFISVLKPLQPLQPLPQLPLEPRVPESSLRDFRQLLSPEKARLMAVIKAKKPVSLYALAKLLARDFKAVRQDVKLLERFGFVRLLHEKSESGKKRLRPMMAVDKLQVTIEI